METNIKGKHIRGNARVSGNAEVFGNARVSGNAEVSGNARVSGKAKVSGDARVSGEARIESGADIARGHGFYSWTLYRTATGHTLVYACVTLDVMNWKNDLDALCDEHDSRDGVRREIEHLLSHPMLS